jgi:hypothetical protein
LEAGLGVDGYEVVGLEVVGMAEAVLAVE